MPRTPAEKILLDRTDATVRIETVKGEIEVEGEHFATEPIPPLMRDMIYKPSSPASA